MPSTDSKIPFFQAFAVAAPGLEGLTSFELRRAGIHNPRQEPGGVTFHGTLADIRRANLWVRTAERILVRISRFDAGDFASLELGARKLSWKKWLRPGAAFALSAACRRSALFHSDAAAQRVADAIMKQVPGAHQVPLSSADAPEGPGLREGTPGREKGSAPNSPHEPAAQRVFVRIDGGVCDISLDSSGDRLHRRGYRKAVTAAPLRETLACAVLLCGGLQALVPALRTGKETAGTRASWLLDPMCGSGTLPIEAARLLCNIAPGSDRTFAFEKWPLHDATSWRALLDEAREKRVPPPPGFTITGSDADGKAIDAARENAARAGIPAELIRWETAPAEQMDACSAPGLIISNPPYGHRLGGARQLTGFFQTLGQTLTRVRPGSEAAFLLPDDGSGFEKLLGFGLERKLRFKNGGLPVGLWAGAIPPT